MRKERRVRSVMELLTKEGTHLKCSKCGIEKKLNEENFYKTTASPVGFKCICKECKKEYYKQNRQDKLQYQKEYIRKNKDYYTAYMTLYRLTKGNVKNFNIKDFRKSQRLQGIKIGA